jgi:hypothetical protein
VADERPGYVRGAAGFSVDARTVKRLAAGFCIVALAVLAVVLVVQGVHTNAQNDRLKNHGLAVSLVVTHCVGRAGGTGITTEGYTCTGTFSLNGRSYTDMIGGSSALHRRGDILDGVTDPHNPKIVATAQSVAATKPSWHEYISAAITFVVLLVVTAFALWQFRRKGRARPRHAAA